jgi:anti-sigma-K factor RskA
VGTQAAPGASARLVPSFDGRHGRLYVQGLPQLTSERQYQLWLIKDGARVNGGVFSVGPTGEGVLYVDAPVPLATYTGFGVTVEPAGGSPGPTGPRVLAAIL